MSVSIANPAAINAIVQFFGSTTAILNSIEDPIPSNLLVLNPENGDVKKGDGVNTYQSLEVLMNVFKLKAVSDYPDVSNGMCVYGVDDTGAPGYMSMADLITNPLAQMSTTLAQFATTLMSVAAGTASNPGIAGRAGTFGGNGYVPVLTIDNKGAFTDIKNAPITVAFNQIVDMPASIVGFASDAASMQWTTANFYSITNPAAYISGITATMVNAALGYVPVNPGVPTTLAGALTVSNGVISSGSGTLAGNSSVSFGNTNGNAALVLSADGTTFSILSYLKNYNLAQFNLSNKAVLFPGGMYGTALTLTTKGGLVSDFSHGMDFTAPDGTFGWWKASTQIMTLDGGGNLTIPASLTAAAVGTALIQNPAGALALQYGTTTIANVQSDGLNVTGLLRYNGNQSYIYEPTKGNVVYVADSAAGTHQWWVYGAPNASMSLSKLGDLAITNGFHGISYTLSTHGGFISDTSSGMDFTAGTGGGFGWWNGSGGKTMSLDSDGNSYILGVAQAVGFNAPFLRNAVGNLTLQYGSTNIGIIRSDGFQVYGTIFFNASNTYITEPTKGVMRFFADAANGSFEWRCNTNQSARMSLDNAGNLIITGVMISPTFTLTTHGGFITDNVTGFDITTGTRGDFGWYSGSTRVMYLNSAGALYVNGDVSVNGSSVWTHANLTDLGQLTNTPGYISGISAAMVNAALGYSAMGRNRNSVNTSSGTTITGGNLTVRWGGEIIAELCTTITNPNEGANFNLIISDSAGHQLAAFNMGVAGDFYGARGSTVVMCSVTGVPIGTVVYAHTVWLGRSTGTFGTGWITIYEC